MSDEAAVIDRWLAAALDSADRADREILIRRLRSGEMPAEQEASLREDIGLPYAAKHIADYEDATAEELAAIEAEAEANEGQGDGLTAAAKAMLARLTTDDDAAASGRSAADEEEAAYQRELREWENDPDW